MVNEILFAFAAGRYHSFMLYVMEVTKMTSEKFCEIRKSCKSQPHELRYFQEVYALSDDIDTLWELKCQFILDDYVEDPSALKIYFNGREEWIFDYLPTKKQASQYIAGVLCPPLIKCVAP